MLHLLGKESDAFLASYSQPPSAGLRLNSLKITPAEFQAISPIPLTPTIQQQITKHDFCLFVCYYTFFCKHGILLF